MTSIKYPSGVSNYFHYDSMLRRYAMEDSDGLRYFSWDYSGLKLLTERDDQGEVTALYSHGYSVIPGIGTIATAQKIESDTTYYQFPLMDHRGSVYRLTNDDGDVVFSAEYNAFGEVLDESNAGATNRLGYQSNWLTLKDSENELVLSPARVYSTKLGRFLQKDMLFQMTLLGQQGSYWNSIFYGYNLKNYSVLYQSFLNNPLSFVDSRGNIQLDHNGDQVPLNDSVVYNVGAVVRWSTNKKIAFKNKVTVKDLPLYPFGKNYQVIDLIKEEILGLSGVKFDLNIKCCCDGKGLEWRICDINVNFTKMAYFSSSMSNMAFLKLTAKYETQHLHSYQKWADEIGVSYAKEMFKSWATVRFNSREACEKSVRTAMQEELVESFSKYNMYYSNLFDSTGMHSAGLRPREIVRKLRIIASPFAPPHEVSRATRELILIPKALETEKAWDKDLKFIEELNSTWESIEKSIEYQSYMKK